MSFFRTRSTSTGITVAEESTTCGLPVSVSSCSMLMTAKNASLINQLMLITVLCVMHSSPIDSIERLDEHKHEMKELWQSLGLLETPEAGLADMVDGKAPIAGCRTAHQ